MSYDAVRTVLIDWLDDSYHFGDAAGLVTSDELSFLENGILDSLGFVQLILFLERTFAIVLDRKDLTRENFDGMRKIITYVISHRDFRGVAG
jgi:acyl carrier protein